MRFTSNDLSDAYVTQQEVNASEGSYTFNDLCTNEHCLEAINSLSTAKKKNSSKYLSRRSKKFHFPMIVVNIFLKMTIMKPRMHSMLA